MYVDIGIALGIMHAIILDLDQLQGHSLQMFAKSVVCVYCSDAALGCDTAGTQLVVDRGCFAALFPCSAWPAGMDASSSPEPGRRGLTGCGSGWSMSAWFCVLGLP